MRKWHFILILALAVAAGGLISGPEAARPVAVDNRTIESVALGDHDGDGDRDIDVLLRGLHFAAGLSGAQEVPGVDTRTVGRFTIGFNSLLSAAAFRLDVFHGEEVTQAHLHCQRAGVNGPVVAFLFPLDPMGVDVNGTLAQGMLTNASFTGADCVPLIGRPVNNIASLALAARDGLIYANVHTLAHPGGEVRGQLLP